MHYHFSEIGTWVRRTAGTQEAQAHLDIMDSFSIHIHPNEYASPAQLKTPQVSAS